MHVCRPRAVAFTMRHLPRDLCGSSLTGIKNQMPRLVEPWIATLMRPGRLICCEAPSNRVYTRLSGAPSMRRRCNLADHHGCGRCEK
jgi:hypothetical protein